MGKGPSIHHMRLERRGRAFGKNNETSQGEGGVVRYQVFFVVKCAILNQTM